LVALLSGVVFLGLRLCAEWQLVMMLSKPVKCDSCRDALIIILSCSASSKALEQEFVNEVIYWIVCPESEVGHDGELEKDDGVGGEGYVNEVLGDILS